MTETAQALNARTWISGGGADAAGCGPIANPCRTLQYAHDQTSSGGEIDAKDSAGYGSVVITKAISIVGDGSLAGVLASAGGNAMEINAGASDKIVLRGLTIEGAGASANGIVFNSGGSLDVVDCVVQGFVGTAPFAGNGLLLKPSTGSPAFTIINSNVSHNSVTGLHYVVSSVNLPAALVIDRVVATDNSYGINIDSPGVTKVVFSNSIASKNTSYGIHLNGSSIKADIDLCHADENGLSGYFFAGNSVTIGRSVGANNTGYGVFVGQGQVSSYGDNRFAGNSSGPVVGAIGTATLY